MTALQYDKLFEPYTRDGHTLENSLKYLSTEAVKRNISPEIMGLAINEIFAKIANGYEYPKDHCQCGCGINKAGTAITHAMYYRMLELDNDCTVLVKDLMQTKYRNFLAGEMKRISKTDKQFIKMNQPPLKERSPILRWLNKLWQ